MLSVVDFKAEIFASPVSISLYPTETASELVLQLNLSLSEIVDKHIPAKSYGGGLPFLWSTTQVLLQPGFKSMATLLYSDSVHLAFLQFTCQ